MVVFLHRPELLLFALDLHHEMGGETVAGQPTTRLEAVRHAVEALVAAKKRLCPEHLFGLITLQQAGATLLPGSVSSSAEVLARHLHDLAPLPPPPAAAEDQPADAESPAAAAAAAAAAAQTPPPFDLGSVIAAASPLASRHPGHRLRVVLVYGRSHLPAPVLASYAGQGLALDCLYVHDKPSGANAVQQVYAALESLVDGVALRRQHAAVIHEVSSSRVGRLLSHMAAMLAHPLQRPPQQQMQPPLDLAAAPLAPLPSDAANLTSGVPIVSPSRQPAALLPGGLSWAAAAARSPGAAVRAAVPPPVASACAQPLQLGGGGEDAWGGGGAASAAAAGSAAVGGKGAWSDPWDEQPQQPLQAEQTQQAQPSSSVATATALSATSDSGAVTAASELVTGMPVELARGVPGASSSNGHGAPGVELLQPHERAGGMVLGLAAAGSGAAAGARSSAGDHPWGSAAVRDGDLAGLDDLEVALMVAAQAEQEEALAAAAAAAAVAAAGGH